MFTEASVYAMPYFGGEGEGVTNPFMPVRMTGVCDV